MIKGSLSSAATVSSGGGIASIGRPTGPHAVPLLALARAYKPGGKAPGPSPVAVGTSDAPIAEAPTTSAGWFDLGFSIPAGASAFVSGCEISEVQCYVNALEADHTNARAWFALGALLEATEQALHADVEADETADGDDPTTCFDAYPNWFSHAVVSLPTKNEGTERASTTVFADDCYAKAIEHAGPADDASASKDRATAYAALHVYLQRHQRFAGVREHPTKDVEKLDDEGALMRALELDHAQPPVAHAMAVFIAGVPAEGLRIRDRSYMGKECFAAALSWPGLGADPAAWARAGRYLSGQPRGESGHPPAVKIGDNYINCPECLARSAALYLTASKGAQWTRRDATAFADVLEDLAGILSRMGPDATAGIGAEEPATAVQLFERALALKPNRPHLWIELATALSTPDARATVDGTVYGASECYAQAVRVCAQGSDASRERKTALAAVLRDVAATVPPGANVLVDGSHLTDVEIAQRAIELDPGHHGGWFALGLALKTYDTARRDFVASIDASTAAAATPHTVTVDCVGGEAHTAFTALSKAVRLAPNIPSAIPAYLNLLDIIPHGPDAAVRINGIRMTNVDLAAGVVSHALEHVGAWRLLGKALLEGQRLAKEQNTPPPVARVLLDDVDDAKLCFVKALVVSGGASPASWAGLLDATPGVEPIVISPQQQFTRRECALNALRRSGLKAASAWLACANVLRDSPYEQKSITMAEIKGVDPDAPAGDNTSAEDAEPIYEKDCLVRCVRHALVNDADVAVEALVRLAESNAESPEETVTVCFRRCSADVFARFDHDVQRAHAAESEGAWQLPEQELTAGGLARVALQAYVTAMPVAQQVAFHHAKAAWRVLSATSGDDPLTIAGCAFDGKQIAANASATSSEPK